MLTIGCLGKTFFQTILDEGVAACIMSLSCWQYLVSPTLVSSSIVLKKFDGHVFKPHRILTTLPIEIGGKIVSIDVEVIDVSLDYNLLLADPIVVLVVVVAHIDMSCTKDDILSL